MNRRAWLALSAGASLAACGNPQPAAPFSTSFVSSVAEHHRVPGYSWILPGAASQDLIYVSDQGVWGKGGVYIYTYPQGKQVGFLEPDTEETYEGLCSDTQGNVWVVGWITNGQAFYDEYSHGSTRGINGLGGSGVPSGCSVDPSTGNLAIANYEDFAVGGQGDIAVYQHAQGSPQDYYDSSITHYYYCTYDGKGNIFADGNANFINELPRNGSALRHVYFNKNIAPGSLQWNARDLAVTVLGGAKGPVRVDRVTVSGSGARIVGTTSLRTYHDEGTYLDVEFAIQAKFIVGPDAGNGGPTRQLYFWPYPAGGKAFKAIQAPDGSNFQGVAISVAH
ncbi:MAG TPA: hypothetical protein VMT95_05570 [Candidatus Binatia bacterium]|nr:hypothetical protein [Candidatus Binatia bacterium]